MPILTDIIHQSNKLSTGADLQNLVNQAALEAARREKEYVDMSDVEFAKDKILMGKLLKAWKDTTQLHTTWVRELLIYGKNTIQWGSEQYNFNLSKSNTSKT